ncbi:MAG: GDYXXLXY domain-containing protein [Verrucomicrobiales bacterium]
MNRTSTIIVAGALLVLVAINAAILRTERRIANGRTVYLEHAPVDPRSLMQGDYMTLDYLIDRQKELRQDLEGHRSRGTLVLQIDEDNIATFARIHDGSPLADNETLLRYRRRGWHITTATASFFFQEGRAEHYQQAKYSKLRVSPDGVANLVALADKDLNPL